MNDAPSGYLYGPREGRPFYIFDVPEWRERVMLVNVDGFTKVEIIRADSKYHRVPKAIRFSAVPLNADFVVETMQFERTTERMADGMVVYREI